MPETIAFEGIRNFRDFGGYSGSIGQVVSGQLFRSAAPDKATPADLARIKQMGIGLYVDLRRWSEREAAPALRPDEFDGSVIEAIERDVMEAPHERYLGGDDLSVPAVTKVTRDFYREAPFDERHIFLFGRAIAELARTTRPILIHCAVGKDRTGLLVSLVQHILGISPEDQMADYLRTREERALIDHLNDRSIAFVRSRGREISIEACEAMTNVVPENLEVAREAMIERCGSIDGYLAMLGVDAATVEAIRGQYIT